MDSTPISEWRDDLTWLEGTILAAMRTWVLGCRRGVSAETPVQIMFANLRTPVAATHLDHLMRSLNQGCTRMIEIYCTCEPVLSADEALLLDMFALVQEDRNGAATDLLQRFVEPAMAHEASGHMLAIVQVLRDAGHTIGRGRAALSRHESAATDPFLSLAMTSRLH